MLLATNQKACLLNVQKDFIQSDEVDEFGQEGLYVEDSFFAVGESTGDGDVVPKGADSRQGTPILSHGLSDYFDAGDESDEEELSLYFSSYSAEKRKVAKKVVSKEKPLKRRYPVVIEEEKDEEEEENAEEEEEEEKEEEEEVEEKEKKCYFPSRFSSEVVNWRAQRRVVASDGCLENVSKRSATKKALIKKQAKTKTKKECKKKKPCIGYHTSRFSEEVTAWRSQPMPAVQKKQNKTLQSHTENDGVERLVDETPKLDSQAEDKEIYELYANPNICIAPGCKNKIKRKVYCYKHLSRKARDRNSAAEVGKQHANKVDSLKKTVEYREWKIKELPIGGPFRLNGTKKGYAIALLYGDLVEDKTICRVLYESVLYDNRGMPKRIAKQCENKVVFIKAGVCRRHATELRNKLPRPSG